MSQLPEIPASAYTREMETLRALPDIPTFDGEPVPVNLGKAHSGGSTTDASAFWDLLDPPMRARVVAAGFGDYAAGLRRTQPRFSPAMRYALMERWNDCTHTFVFGFGEMTLTSTDYAAITGLRFTGPVPPLDARGFSANDFLFVGDFLSYFASQMQAQLPEVLEYTQEQKTHKTVAHYRAEAAAEAGGAAAPTGPVGVVLGDVPFPSGMEVVLDPSFGLGSGIVIPADLRQAPPPELENGRLRRHQSRQSSAVSRLQAEVERLWTRLEVEGIPLDSSDEDEDGSSSDGAPPSPPHPTVADAYQPEPSILNCSSNYL
ncbi:hypothetical protein JCGZ_26455 [Jatropha curcas]|uniref:Aminotransferase-like plant mobile domain-containing protein n=1 Tax=Jatropha curcas TaxID=180498 RepID=A0A067JLA0_JATCU|nr:hypothetical protein JCGZ_26455 [Jatropha curcas]